MRPTLTEITSLIGTSLCSNKVAGRVKIGVFVSIAIVVVLILEQLLVTGVARRLAAMSDLPK
jgi:hypothetical protein